MARLLQMRFPMVIFSIFLAIASASSVSKAGAVELQAAAASEQVDLAKFKICPDAFGVPDVYALCYTAKCWTLDGVTYCKCDLKNGKSISLPFNYREDGQKKDVCDIFMAGIGNGFTVSTYSPPRQMQKDYEPDKEKLGPPMALYSCPGTSVRNTGYSAQCDGGLCFRSTSGTDFPGLGHVDNDEIICSCPPIANIPIGFQMAGPWNCEPGARNKNGECCDADYMQQYCNVDHIRRTGTSMVISSPTGFAAALAKKLTGELPRFNQCR